MNEEQISMVDPSLPLADTSLAPPLPSRQVRFVPAEPPDPPPDQEFLPSWQVDGSIENSSATFQAHYTMREYDDQLNTMKKENLNLKLRSELTFPIIFIIFVLNRIYFMEERLGMLKSTNNQENIYKVNIDLKVHGEELKKVEHLNKTFFGSE